MPAPPDFNILFANLKPHLWEMVTDSARFVRHALEAAGARVRIGTNQLDSSGAINLFFDRFYEDPALPRQLKAAGVRFGLVCTEVIAPDGTWNYGAENEPPGTFAAFEIAAKSADFVWCQLAESLPAVRALNPRAAHLPFGYLAAMETLRDTPWSERDIDCLMVGLPSLRRDDVAGDINARGLRLCYPGLPVPLAVRDGLMERARLQLSVQKTVRHKIVSVSRICHSIINRVPLLLESDATDNPYARYCLMAAPNTVAVTAQRHLAETDLEAWAKGRYDAFKQEMPMADAMARVLKETVA